MIFQGVLTIDSEMCYNMGVEGQQGEQHEQELPAGFQKDNPLKAKSGEDHPYGQQILHRGH